MVTGSHTDHSHQIDMAPGDSIAHGHQPSPLATLWTLIHTQLTFEESNLGSDPHFIAQSQRDPTTCWGWGLSLHLRGTAPRGPLWVTTYSTVDLGPPHRTCLCQHVSNSASLHHTCATVLFCPSPSPSHIHSLASDSHTIYILGNNLLYLQFSVHMHIFKQ